MAAHCARSPLAKIGFLAILLLLNTSVALLFSAAQADALDAIPVPGDPLEGNGAVARLHVSYPELTGPFDPASPVDDEAFAVPENAAHPSHQFEGTLHLVDPGSVGGFESVAGADGIPADGRHLPELSITFVQNGSHLVPTVQGLRITGSPYWNLLVGPGRAWTEVDDEGLTRAAFPFALVQRNQNCTHNGLMMFLFDDTFVSNVRYQITQETCRARKFNLWGQVAAGYSPESLPEALTVSDGHALELMSRLPTRPFAALAQDYPDSGIVTTADTTLAAPALPGDSNIKVAAVTGLAIGQVITIDDGSQAVTRTIIGPASAAYAFNGTAGAGGTGVEIAPPLTHSHDAGSTVQRPANFGAVAQTSAFGVVFEGVNYVSECPTRFGFNPYCADLRLPSYSLAKTIMANVALMRLSQEYGPEVYDLKLRDYIPEMTAHPNWPADTSATFNNAADMATGNWNSKGYQADESAAGPFLGGESHTAKMTAALDYTHRPGQQDVTWVYRTSDTFLLTSAMNDYLASQLGQGADSFDLLIDDVYVPLPLSAGALSTIRTDNAAIMTHSPTGGVAWGGYGMFLNLDDVAKLSKLLNNDLGAIEDTQVLDRRQVLAGLQRLQADRGVPANSSLLTGADAVAGSYRYSNGLWAYPTTAQVPGCVLRIPFMSGFGGITVALMPNGATYYYFADSNSFIWATTIRELDKLSPMCAATATLLASDAPLQIVGEPVTFTASVGSPDRSWAATGTVRFKSGDTFLSEQLMLDEQGEVTFTTDELPLGAHAITAWFTPDNTSSTEGYRTATSTTSIIGGNCSTGTGTVTLTVDSSAGFAPGDDVLLGSNGAFGVAVDEVRITAVPDATSLQYIGNCTYYSHIAPFPVLQRNTAGGGFAASGSADIFQQVVKHPEDQLIDLLEAVGGTGSGQSLYRQVQAILQKVENGSQPAACNQLVAFKHAVAAQSGKQIAESLANQFISDAELIEATLGCS